MAFGRTSTKRCLVPRIKYRDINLGASKLAVVETANKIIVEYSVQGFDLTLRQLYYQFVSRALIPNTQAEYKKLGDIINDGRLVGLIDWRPHPESQESLSLE